MTRSTRSNWQKAKETFDHWSKKLQTKRNGRILSALFLILAIATIGRIVHGNWETFRSFDWQIRPLWLIAVLIFFLIDLVVATWGWHLLTVRLANYNNFRQSTKICWSSNLAKRVPTPIWYIAGRALMYEKEGVSKRTTSLLGGLELVFFFVSGVITAVITLPFYALPPEIASQKTQLIATLILIPITLAFANPRLLEAIWQKISKEKLTHRLTWQDTLYWLFIYILAWVFGAFVFFSTINFVYPLAWSHFPQILGIWSLSSAISLAGTLTISIIGLREISLALLLVPLLPAPVILIVAIGIRLVWIIGELLSALIAWRL